MIRNAARVEAYRKNHGNTFVPRVHQGYPSLGNWVDTQRSEYVHYQKKKAIGEKWNAHRCCVCVWPPVKGELLLSMRYQSLVLTSMMSPPYPKPQ